MNINDRPYEQKLLKNIVEVINDAVFVTLVGAYLYGSLATGDFVSNQSDVDLLFVVENDIDEKLLRSLTTLHSSFNSQHESWGKRIDVAYVAVSDLKTVNSRPYSAIVSDGKGSLEIVDAPEYYLIDWFKVQERSIKLLGPEIKTMMPHITVRDFKKVIRNYMLTWKDKTSSATRRGLQAYIVLTMCRSLYAYEHGENVSKKQGAQWATSQYPQWNDLIDKSVSRSRISENSDGVDLANQKQVQNFVKYILSKI